MCLNNLRDHGDHYNSGTELCLTRSMVDIIGCKF